MTMLLVSTGRRHVPFSEPSGYFHTIDLQKREILRTSLPIEPVYRQYDDNPRGGLRGCRGIALGEGEVALSNSSVVFRYDPHWNLLGTITHPSCAGIHDITYQDESLWVTGTRADFLLQFDLAGRLIRHHDMRRSSPAIKSLGWRVPVLLSAEEIEGGVVDFRDPRTHDREAHNRAHINGVCVLPDGRVLASLGLVMSGLHSNLIRVKVALAHIGLWDPILSLNQWIKTLLKKTHDVNSGLIVQPVKGQSAVLLIDPDGDHSQVIKLEHIRVPSHSLMTMPDGTIIYLNTSEGEVIHYSIQSSEVLSSTKVTDGFLRGVDQIADDLIVLGSSQELLIFDLKARRVLSKFTITTDTNEAVYDVIELSGEFALPPVSFEAHFQETIGYPSSAIVMGRHVATG
jgi:hypothetical protein